MPAHPKQAMANKKHQLLPEKGQTPKYHIKNFQAQREAAKSRPKDPTARNTAVCGVPSPSLPLDAAYDNPEQLAPSKCNPTFPYACPRCFQRIRRRNTVKGHFLKCVNKNGNPDRLFWSQCEGYALGCTYGEPKRVVSKKHAAGNKSRTKALYGDEISKEEEGVERKGKSVTAQNEEVDGETDKSQTNMKRTIRRMFNSAGFEESDEPTIDARRKKSNSLKSKEIYKKRKRNNDDDDNGDEDEISPWARPLHKVKKQKIQGPWHQQYSDDELNQLFVKIDKQRAIASRDSAERYVKAQPLNSTSMNPSRKRSRSDDSEDEEKDEDDNDDFQTNGDYKYRHQSCDDSEDGHSEMESDEDEDSTTKDVEKSTSRRKKQRRLEPGEDSEAESVIIQKPTKWRARRFSDYHTRDSEHEIEVAKKGMVNAVYGYIPVVYHEPVTELQFYAETEELIRKGWTGHGDFRMGLDVATMRRYEAGEIFCLDQARRRP